MSVIRVRPTKQHLDIKTVRGITPPDYKIDPTKKQEPTLDGLTFVSKRQYDVYVPDENAIIYPGYAPNRGYEFIITPIEEYLEEHPETKADKEAYRATEGSLTAGFFFRSTDFLMEAAKNYALLEEGQGYNIRGIEDDDFVVDVLFLFNDRNYEFEERQVIKKQIDNIVLELAQKIKNGESTDLDKLENKLVVGGAEVSFTQLMEMQEIGQQMVFALDRHMAGSSVVGDIAIKGIAKSFADYYGSQNGEIGEKFANKITEFFDKSLVRNRDFIETQTQYLPAYANAQSYLGLESAELFAGMDTSSRSALIADFSRTYAEFSKNVDAYSRRHGVSSWMLEEQMQTVTNFFNGLTAIY